MSKTLLRSPPEGEHKTDLQPTSIVADHAFRHELTCPGCHMPFTPARRNQKYCNRKCQKKTTRNTARGSRKGENKRRNETHYGRAAWLSFDMNRLPPDKRRRQMLALLEAASGEDAALRNILSDPNLLGAERSSPVGKLSRDAKDPTVLNIAKMAHRFCLEEWGCSSRDAICDGGVPAGRVFREGAPTAVHLREEPLPPYIKRDAASFLAHLRVLWAGSSDQMAA